MNQLDPSTDAPHPSPGPRRAPVWAGLLAILLLAGTLRSVGWDFGLPYPYASKDETIVTDRAMRFAEGDLNPHYFAYPTFYFYQQGVVLEAVARVGAWLGHYPDVAAGRRAYYVDPSAHFLAARGWTIALGLLAVLLTYLLGREVGGELRLGSYGPDTLGLVSAGLLAVNHLHAQISKFVELDVPLSVCATGCVLACLRYRRSGGWGALLGAALLAGLGASTKYYGALLCLPIALAVLLRALAPAGAGLRREALRLGAAAALMIAAFLGTSPYVLLDHQTFLQEFRFLFEHMEGGHYGQEVPRSGFVVYLEMLWHPWGGRPLCLALGLGTLVFLSGRPRPSTSLLLALFPVVFYVVLARMRIHFPGYLAAILPLLSVWAAVGVLGLARLLATALCPVLRSAKTAAAVALAVCLLPWVPEAARAWENAVAYTRPDSRLLLHDWAVAHAPNGATFAGETWLHLPLDEDCLRAMLRTLEAEEVDRQAQARGEPAGALAAIPLPERRLHGDWGREHLQARLRWVVDQSPAVGFDLVQLPPTFMDPQNLPAMRATGIRYVVLSSSRFLPLLQNPDLDQIRTQRPMYARLAAFYQRLLQGDLVVARFPAAGQQASGPELVVCDLQLLAD